MVKDGVRASKIPPFEATYNWVESIAASFVLSFPIVVITVVIMLIFPEPFNATIPIVNISGGFVVFLGLWIAIAGIAAKYTSIRKKEYEKLVAEQEQKDDEEYQSFVKLAKGERS
jgi:hypothetical protein